jgi:hypothetical protein
MQHDLSEEAFDTTPNCGNVLMNVVQFALNRPRDFARQPDQERMLTLNLDFARDINLRKWRAPYAACESCSLKVLRLIFDL